MFSRPSVAAFLCFAMLIAFSRSKPQKPKADQSYVVNNNCGLAKVDRNMMAHIKAKVDFIAKQSSKGSACSDGWVLRGKSCFLVIDIPTLEWNDARRTCQKLGGDLPKITSAAENQFILDLVTKQKKVTVYGVWLGLHRKPADKKFYWVDGTLLTGYNVWNRGEPNSVREECAHMYGKGSFKGKWNDINCACSNHYAKMVPIVLCEKKTNQ